MVDYEYIAGTRTEHIEIKIKRINQLFNSFDPSPFLEKDLDDDAFEYLVSSVAEHPLKTKQKIIIFIPLDQKKKMSEIEIKRGIHNFFNYKKTLADKSIRLKLEEGQMSLIIGVVFLSSCIILKEIVSGMFQNFFVNVLAEGLIIGGWVAMWKPISNILYDWWPLRKEKNIYEKIANMDVDFKYT